MTPQIIISLGPEGELVCELPGTMGTRRKVVMTPGKVEETIEVILNGLFRERAEIGLDGAPTQAQVTHWEKHQVFAREGCRFCIAEGRFVSSGTEKKKTRETLMKRGDGVEVRRILPKVSGLKKEKKPRQIVVVEGPKRAKSATGLDL